MPRIWTALELHTPAEKEGGEPEDFCIDCIEDALLDRQAEAGEILEARGEDADRAFDLIVENDEHPPYNDFGEADYTCCECGKALDEERDGYAEWL